MTDTKKDIYFLKDEFALKLFRDPDLQEYLIRVVCSIVKDSPNFVGEDFEILNTKISPSTDSKNVEGDLVFRTKYGIFSLEINYNGPTLRTINKNFTYMCSLVLKQLKKNSNRYEDIQKVVQINLNRYDEFKQGKFIYVSSMMEEELHIKRSDIFTIYDVDMDFLSKIDYNVIRNLKIDTPEKLLYILTCSDRNLWDKIYGDDELMRKVEEKIGDLDRVLNAYLAYDKEEFERRNIEELAERKIREEGREEGAKQKNLENAIAFIKKGIDKDFVIETLNLTKEEIKQLEL